MSSSSRPVNFRKSHAIVYRSAAPLDDQESRYLETLNVKSVVDLRGKGEGHFSFSIENQIQVGSMTRALLHSAPYLIQLLVLILWLFNRSLALKAFSYLYLNRIGLRGMMHVYVSRCQKEIRTILEFFAADDESNLPVLIHCSLGKDRTGLLCAIVGLLASTPRESIVQDYLQSEAGLLNAFHKYRSSFEKMGLDEKMALVSRDAIEVVFEFIDSQGGIDRYLVEYVQLQSTTVQQLRKQLLQTNR